MPIKEAVNIYDYEFKNRSNLFNHGVRLRRGNSHGFFCRNGLDVPALPSTNDDIEDIQDMRNIGYCNGKWWWATYTTGADTVALKVYSAPSLTGASSLEYTEDYTNVTHGGNFTVDAVHEVLLRTIGVNILVAINFQVDDGGATKEQRVHGCYSTDSGANFTVIDSTWEAPSDIQFYTLADGVEIDSKPFLVGVQKDTDYLLFVSMADTTGTAISCDDLNRVYAGFIDSDGNYRFVYQEKTTTDWYIATYDGVNGPDGETHVELITFTEPTNWNAQEQIYFFSGGIELLIDKDYIRYRISGTAWNETPASNPPSDITIIYTKDQLGIAAIIFDGYIWQIINGGIGKLQKYTGNHTTGHIDWFTNGTDTIKQYIPSTDKNGITLFLSNLKYSMLAGSFQELNAADVWNTDEIVSIYDDDDVLRRR